jgi:hypothetical protein
MRPRIISWCVFPLLLRNARINDKNIIFYAASRDNDVLPNIIGEVYELVLILVASHEILFCIELVTIELRFINLYGGRSKLITVNVISHCNCFNIVRSDT